MRIVIITMDDPLYTIPFIKEIINGRKNDIVGLAVAKGDRMKIGKKRSKIVYLFSLLMIMGITNFLKNTLITLKFKLKKKLSNKFGFIESPSIQRYAEKNGIKTYQIKSPNAKEFLEELSSLEPDVIINQSQFIIKKKLLDVPKIGVLNRHNALLPKNRGRLTPFWVMYKGEKETGVSIHFVDEGIDSGEIVVQEKFSVNGKDNFNTIVKKNYQLAGKAMLKALDILENGERNFMENNDDLATYNTVPTLKKALRYRIGRILSK
jgi:methionyl-tRNA formyltransferase